MNGQNFRAGTDRRAERERLIAAARRGGITDTYEAESHVWAKRDALVGRLLCALSAAVSLTFLVACLRIIGEVQGWWG